MFNYPIHNNQQLRRVLLKINASQNKKIRQLIHRLVISEIQKFPIDSRKGANDLDYFLFHETRISICIQIILMIAKESNLKIRNILDVGAFYGHLLIPLTHFNFKLNATDLEVFFKNKTIKERFQRYGIEYRSYKNLNHLPFVDNSFDMIILSEVLEHLFYSPITMFLEIKRVLKPKGHLILTTPNVFSLPKKIKFLLGQNIYPPLEDFCTKPYYSIHHREWGLNEIKTIISLMDLKLTNSYHVTYYYSKSILRRYFKKFVYSLFPSLNEDIIVTACFQGE